MSETDDIAGEAEQALATGSHAVPSHLVRCELGPYQVLLRLGPGNVFLELVEVRQRGDLVPPHLRVQTRDWHDVDDLYED